MQGHLIEIGKEALRVVVLALVSWLLTDGVLNSVLGMLFSAHLDAAQVILVSGLLTSVLRGIDKDLHDSGKMKKGLTQF